LTNQKKDFEELSQISSTIFFAWFLLHPIVAENFPAKDLFLFDDYDCPYIVYSS
jgi:hypothetical protein